jgi:hypothetical protein
LGTSGETQIALMVTSVVSKTMVKLRPSSPTRNFKSRPGTTSNIVYA